MHYVYIIKSKFDGVFYKGYTTNYHKRIEEHNNGLSRYTAKKIPWELIYVEEHPDKTSALIREKKLKRCKSEYFEWLKENGNNILKR